MYGFMHKSYGKSKLQIYQSVLFTKPVVASSMKQKVNFEGQVCSWMFVLQVSLSDFLDWSVYEMTNDQIRQQHQSK